MKALAFKFMELEESKSYSEVLGTSSLLPAVAAISRPRRTLALLPSHQHPLRTAPKPVGRAGCP